MIWASVRNAKDRTSIERWQRALPLKGALLVCLAMAGLAGAGPGEAAGKRTSAAAKAGKEERTHRKCHRAAKRRANTRRYHRRKCHRRGTRGKGKNGAGPSGAAGETIPPVASLPGRPGEVLVVSPRGDDSGSGSKTSPLRTIDRALAMSSGGEAIVVMPGAYSGFRDTRRRSSAVTLIGIGAPTVSGAGLMGNSNLHIRGLRFDASVLIRRHPTYADRHAEEISIRDSELTSGTPLSSRCLTIRDGARRVTVAGNHIHDCKSGIDGPGYGFSDPSAIPYSSQIVIRDNRFERFRADAIQFGYWRDVTIADNTIREMRDPAHVEHNDGIQVMGGSSRIRIERNVIADSRGQLILVQGVLGQNDDILIRDNLSYGSATYAWQLGDVTNLRVYGNTVWRSKYGGILLRPGAQARVANNIADFIGSAFGSAGGSWEYFDHNLVGRTWNTAGPHSLVGVDPAFVDPSIDDYRLRDDSPAVGAGAAEYSGATDLTGRPRPSPPSIGALEPGAGRLPG